VTAPQLLKPSLLVPAPCPSLPCFCCTLGKSLWKKVDFSGFRVGLSTIGVVANVFAIDITFFFRSIKDRRAPCGISCAHQRSRLGGGRLVIAASYVFLLTTSNLELSTTMETEVCYVGVIWRTNNRRSNGICRILCGAVACLCVLLAYIFSYVCACLGVVFVIGSLLVHGKECQALRSSINV